MATPQLSPGVLVREVDLTVGRVDNVLDNVGAIAGPFSIGPVDEPTAITTEQELLNTFGKPISTDAQYEYWLTAASYLTYGGVLRVVRTDGTNLVNANAIRNVSGISTAGDPSLKIKNFTDYEVTRSDEGDAGNYIFAAKSPGSWANTLKVAIIDNKADQILNVGTGVTINNGLIGLGVTTPLVNVPFAGSGTTSTFNGYLKSIVTGINTIARTVDVKIVSIVSTAGEETRVNYSQRSDLTSIRPSDAINFINSSGVSVGSTVLGSGNAVLDWYDEQTIQLAGTSVFWKTIAPKPGTTGFAEGNNGLNDELHVVVYDDTGSITGISGNLIEKHIGLSKATDAISDVNSPLRNWWKGYIAQYSKYLYAGLNPSSSAADNEPSYATGFSEGFTAYSEAEGLWNQNALNVTFSAAGNVTYTLTGGQDYSPQGGMKPSLGDIINSYSLFEDRNNIQADYLIMGPGFDNIYDTQAKANYLISLATLRKDCIATISPNKEAVVNISDPNVQTNNIIEFFSPLQSSSYAVFDSGWKFTYDRFNNRFRYIPCNGDVAGLMVRTAIFAQPWFSPAGQQRGILNNAVKLAYNPNTSQYDRIYPQRVNAIVNRPGTGIYLNGDKTALGYASAFDRINVRRLFLTVQKAIQRTSESVLFEINDEITRANFVNIVEPYLRDVQAKRGLYGFIIKCDESNNTPDIIDNNEFRADIFLKPAKSINYVTLTFVATRTGTSFEEVAGTV
jgi:hypothetical protein